MMPMNPNSPRPETMMPAGQSAGPQKDEVKMQLIQLLGQAKKMAEQNGLSWDEIVSSLSGSKVNSVPRTPYAPPPGRPMMGG